MFSDPNTYYGFVLGAAVCMAVYQFLCWREDRRKRRNKQPGVIQPHRPWPRR